MTVAILTINAVFCADDLLQRVVGLRADLHGLGEGGSTGREEHELLERKLVASMRTTVDDIEGGSGEDEGGLHTREVSEVLVERDTLLRSTRLRDGDGDTEDRVRAELAFVGGAVELDEEVVDLLLRGDLQTGLDQLGGDGVVDVGDGLGDTCEGIAFECMLR